MKILAYNKYVKAEFSIIEALEVGIVLTGSEVKSLRFGRCSINESFAGECNLDGHVALCLFNMNISEYAAAPKGFAHEPKRTRKLLLHKRQQEKFLGSVKRKGYTIVPLRLYFNNQGRVKLEIALAQGRKTVDKRNVIKEREWKRDKARILKHNNR